MITTEGTTFTLDVLGRYICNTFDRVLHITPEYPPMIWGGLGTAAAADVRRAWLWPHIVTKMRTVYGEAMRAA